MLPDAAQEQRAEAKADLALHRKQRYLRHSYLPFPFSSCKSSALLATRKRRRIMVTCERLMVEQISRSRYRVRANKHKFLTLAFFQATRTSASAWTRHPSSPLSHMRRYSHQPHEGSLVKDTPRPVPTARKERSGEPT